MGKLRRVLAICFCGALLGTPAKALDPGLKITQYAHTAWRVQDGVFTGAPHAIAQTADGYLWIGTESGLVRFDGVRFVPWNPPGRNPLLNSIIVTLLGARDGSLWIGTSTGLQRLNLGELRDFPEAPGRIDGIIEDRENKIWFVRARFHDKKGPLCRVDGDALRCFGQADGMSFPVATALAQDQLGSFWVGNSQGICRWKPGACSTFIPDALRENHGLAGVSSILPQSDGSLVIGIARSGPGLGLQRFAKEAWSGYVVPGMNGTELEVSEMLTDRDDGLWVGTFRHGIYRIHDGQAAHFGSADGLSSDSVESFFQDREGNLWVTTSKGLDCFRDVRVASFSISEGLTSDNASAVVATRDNTVWVSNAGSLDSLRQGKISSIGLAQGLPGHRVTALFEDHAGRLWVGVDGGLNLFEHGRFHPIKGPDGKALGVVTAMTEDTDRNLWAEVLGNPNQLARIRDGKALDEMPASQVTRSVAIAADPQEGIWLDLDHGHVGHYHNGQTETLPASPEGGGVSTVALLAEPDGSVWGATSRGVVRWKDGRVQTLNSRNGLPCDGIYALVRDNANALWLSSRCGYVAIADSELEKWWEHPAATVSLRTFDVLDGALPASTPFHPAATKSPDGRLWFANDSILQMIDPGHLGANTLPPPVHIEQIIADRKNYSPDENLRLPPRTRDLEIDYTALSFSVPQKVRFRYKLEGHDAEWEDPQTRREAFYTDLGPGKYRVRVMACNNDGVWNEAGAALNFEVLPAFYQTTWFLLMFLAAAACLAWAVYRWRIRQVAARLDALFQERLAERTSIAQDLHDTLLQGFLSASMQLHVANERLPADSPAKPIVKRVIELMGNVINDGRNTVRGLRSSGASDDLDQAFSRIPQELAVQRAVDFRVIVEGQPRRLYPGISDEVYRIGREALANAFRHAEASRIEVELEYAEAQLRLRVRDDGRGIDPQVLRTGRDGHWGLVGMRERAERIGARLKVWSRDAGGTEVELSVPGHVAFPSGPSHHGLRWFARWRSRPPEDDPKKLGAEVGK